MLNSKTETSQTVRKHKQNISIALGGLCYYIGDNLPPLIREYQKELCGKDQERVDIVQLLKVCMLVIATAIYIPVLVDGALPPNKEKEETVPTYKKEEQTGSLTKEQIEETVQLLTKKTGCTRTQFTWLFSYYW